MSELLNLCDKYFGFRNFYEVLNIDKDSSPKEIKKAYHRLSLLVHPDRVSEDKKVEATEKFKVLGKIHSILSDPQKKAVYDESGDFDEANDPTFDWAAYWRSLFKKITIEDIKKYEKEYINSELELRDIKRSYLDGKGSMDYILECVPFSDCDSEARIKDIVKELIKKEEVPEYKCFTNEPAWKVEKRRRRWEKEKEEAASVNHNELMEAIQKNQEKRDKEINNFFNNLEAKYCGKQNKRKSIKSPGQKPVMKPKKKK